MTDKLEKPLPLWGIWVSMIIWGVSWSSAKVLSRFGGPAEIAMVRFALAFFALGFLLKFFKIPFRVAPGGKRYLVLATIFMSGYSIVFFTGLQKGLSGVGGVIVTTLSPLFAFALTSLQSRRWPFKFQRQGLAIGGIGLLCMVKIWNPDQGLFDPGTFLFVVAASLWASMSVISAKAHIYAHPLAYSFWLNGLSALPLLFVVDLSVARTMLTVQEPLFWANLFHFSLINSAGATTFYLVATQQWGAQKTAGYMYLVPAAAVISGFVFLGEKSPWYTLVGGALSVLAVMRLQGISKGSFVRKTSVDTTAFRAAVQSEKN